MKELGSRSRTGAGWNLLQTGREKGESKNGAAMSCKGSEQESETRRGFRRFIMAPNTRRIHGSIFERRLHGRGWARIKSSLVGESLTLLVPLEIPTSLSTPSLALSFSLAAKSATPKL